METMHVHFTQIGLSLRTIFLSAPMNNFASMRTIGVQGLIISWGNSISIIFLSFFSVFIRIYNYAKEIIFIYK